MSERKNSLAVQRVERLLDDNSFVELGADITARNTDFTLNREKAPSDGVVCGHGTINGNLVFVYSQDPDVLGGTIGEMHAKKIARIYEMAVDMNAPVIGIIDCGGVRLDESYDALESMGLITSEAADASGVVPEIAAVFGKCGGGLSAVASISDFTFVSDKGSVFLNSPDAIPGNSVDACDSSSPEFALKKSGIADCTGTEEELTAKIRDLVSILAEDDEDEDDDLNRASTGLEDKRYDTREFAKEISDSHVFFETKQGFEKNMTTGFIRLGGMTVGLVGNRSRCAKCGKDFSTDLTAAGIRKAADFIRFCDAFDYPVLTLTNVSGYEKSVHNEITLPRELARFAVGLASSDIPKINLITDSAFGTPYIFMNSKSLGADIVMAYPDSRMGIMDASLASKIICEDGTAEEQAEVAEKFEEIQSGTDQALRRGYIDRIINFSDTRKYLIAGFEMLESKAEYYRKHTAK